jgi:hypothetical protein
LKGDTLVWSMRKPSSEMVSTALRIRSRVAT